MGVIERIAESLPDVSNPKERRLSFNIKLKWTLIILVAFYVLGLIPLYGLGVNSLQQFEFFSMILGASFGSIISLGIGPIVTASIVLQLLNGAGILKFDLTTTEGKKNFEATQKVLSILFIILEAAIYVFMGGLAPDQALRGSSAYFQMQLLLILQLCIGGFLILLMDAVVSKWGFGSGISLFIAGGVAKRLFIRALNPLPSPSKPDIASGALIGLFQSLGRGDPTTAAILLSEIVSTIVVFLLVVYLQSMRVEIPLSFGMVRGYGIRWPLSFLYTSNIPVILVAALIANIRMFGRMLSGRDVSWLINPNIVQKIITGSLGTPDLMHALVYVLIMIGGAILFSVFWVQTAGLDAKSQAKQISSSGLQVSGFRRDIRVIEALLNRYIPYLTVLGGAAVGLLAALADLTGTLAGGTGILLAVMIVYRLYEEITQQHALDMNPMLRKMIETK